MSSPSGETQAFPCLALAHCQYCLSKHRGGFQPCQALPSAPARLVTRGAHEHLFPGLELHGATCSFWGALDLRKMLRCPVGSRHRMLPRRGAPPAPPAAQGPPRDAELEQGKVLTADVPQVEAFDHLGGDKKGRDFRRHQAPNPPINNKPGTSLMNRRHS